MPQDIAHAAAGWSQAQLSDWIAFLRPATTHSLDPSGNTGIRVLFGANATSTGSTYAAFVSTVHP